MFSDQEQASPRAGTRGEAALQDEDGDVEQPPEPAEELCNRVMEVLREVAAEQTVVIQGICRCA